MPRRAAFFDLDKTVIAKSSALAFGRHFYASGLINRRAVIKSTYAQFVYALGGADDDQMARMRDELARMVTGWDVAQVRGIVAEALHDLIDPLVYDEAAGLIESHHAQGDDVVIVSSSGEEVVTPIGALLGADHVIATRMVVQAGRYTGDIDFYAAGVNKAVAMRELAAERGYDLSTCHAYSDSISDVPMLEAVGHPHAVNPDRSLRKEAQARDWPVVDFRHPVPLHARVGLPARPSPPLAAGVAALALGLVVAGRIARRTQQSRKQGNSGLVKRPRRV